jgi:hypothetical protein
MGLFVIRVLVQVRRSEMPQYTSTNPVCQKIEPNLSIAAGVIVQTEVDRAAPSNVGATIFRIVHFALAWHADS